MVERRCPNTATCRNAAIPGQAAAALAHVLQEGGHLQQDSEHATFCNDLYEKQNLVTQGPYTPMPLEGNALTFPSTLGGGNWGGVSFDPKLGYLFTNVMNIGQWGHMQARTDPKTGVVTYVKTAAVGGAYARFWDPATHVPCTNPPFGELVAVNANTGDIAWKSPLGIVEALEAKGWSIPERSVLAAASRPPADSSSLQQRTTAASGHSTPKPARNSGRNHRGERTCRSHHLSGQRREAICGDRGRRGSFFGGATSDAIVAFALP